MSYNLTANRIASEVRTDLPRLVSDAKRSAPKEEHSLIELSGQYIHYVLSGIDDDNLVELQAYGADTPSVGERVAFVSLKTRAIKAKAVAAEVPWTPDQGPLGPVRSESKSDAASAVPANNA